MKRWAIVCVLLYALLLGSLVAPLTFILLGPWVGDSESSFLQADEIAPIFSEPLYWVFLAPFFLTQAALVLLPLDAGDSRQRARRHVLVPIVAGGFLASLLLVTGAFSIICAIFGDDALEFFSADENQLANFVWPGWRAFISAHAPGLGLSWVAGLVACVLAAWIAWGWLFHRACRADPHVGSRRVIAWLLRGSIVEFLIAIPCHIITRNRDTCCAPVGTFAGIVTGLAVMLAAFGPGILYLYADRLRRLRAKRD